MPNGCFAETRIKGPVLDQMKKGKQLNIVAKGLANNEVTFVLAARRVSARPSTGAAIPPEVIAKQQQDMQAELQKQLEARAQAATAADREERRPRGWCSGCTPAPRLRSPDQASARRSAPRRPQRYVACLEVHGRGTHSDHGASKRPVRADRHVRREVTNDSLIYPSTRAECSQPCSAQFRAAALLLYSPASVLTKISSICGCRNGSPDSSGSRFCSDT